jgi:hypothetical protein
LRIEKYELYAILSRPNECVAEGLEMENIEIFPAPTPEEFQDDADGYNTEKIYEEEMENIEIFIAPGILTQEETNTIIDGASDALADQLEKFKNFSQTEEDAKAILKDAEKI